ncbi:hypothetical protein AHAS_Ahas09G0128200 [Arachis hypogaea]
MIRSIKACQWDLGEDMICWLPSSTGIFSIKSTYLTIHQSNPSSDFPFDKISKFKFPQRLRDFTWLLSQNGLLTNENRARRRLTEVADYPRCPNNSDTLLHVMRDCPFISRTWKSLVNRNSQQNFFQTDIQAWMKENLWSPHNRNGTSCPIIFITTCNLAWKSRNELIFQNFPSNPKTLLNQAIYLAKNYEDCLAISEVEVSTLSTSRKDMIGWEPPTEGWFKLNVDGSVMPPASMASCSGLIRDCQGKMIAVFMMNLGNYSITLAGLWGLYTGIKLARELGIGKLLIETVSLCASKFVQNMAPSRTATTPYCVPSSCFLLTHGMFVSPMSTEKGIFV